MEWNQCLALAHIGFNGLMSRGLDESDDRLGYFEESVKKHQSRDANGDRNERNDSPKNAQSEFRRGSPVTEEDSGQPFFRKEDEQFLLRGVIRVCGFKAKNAKGRCEDNAK